MERKISCGSCGAFVLAATAERHGGRCAPCGKGTRAQIEASKQRAGEERSRPEVRNYWLPLLDQVNERGFESLDRAQRICYSVGLLDIEAFNGGIEQFFTNSAGRYYAEAEAGLEALDLVECLDLLRQAKRALFGNESEETDRALRVRTALEAVKDQSIRRILDEVSRNYWRASEQTRLLERVEQFADRNELQFVFPAPGGRGSLWQAY